MWAELAHLYRTSDVAPLFGEPTHTPQVTFHETPTASLHACGNARIIWVMMPSHTDMAELIQDLHEDPYRAVVVDYYGDVLRLMEAEGIDDPAMRKAGRSNLPGAWEYWREPSRQAAMTRSLSFATMVVTPWESLLRPLWKLNDSVFWLPDHVGDGRAFSQAAVPILVTLAADIFSNYMTQQAGGQSQ